MSNNEVDHRASLSLSSFEINSVEVGDGIEFAIEATAGGAPRAVATINLDMSMRGKGCMSRGCQRGSAYVLYLQGEEARVCDYHFDVITAILRGFSGNRDEGSFAKERWNVESD